MKNIEQLLVNEWRLLSPDKQQQVIDFILFLGQNYGKEKPSNQTKEIEPENDKFRKTSLEGSLIYYDEPLDPVALEDWEAMM